MTDDSFSSSVPVILISSSSSQSNSSIESPDYEADESDVPMQVGGGQGSLENSSENDFSDYEQEDDDDEEEEEEDEDEDAATEELDENISDQEGEGEEQAISHAAGIPSLVLHDAVWRLTRLNRGNKAAVKSKLIPSRVKSLLCARREYRLTRATVETSDADQILSTYHDIMRTSHGFSSYIVFLRASIRFRRLRLEITRRKSVNKPSEATSLHEFSCDFRYTVLRVRSCRTYYQTRA